VSNFFTQYPSLFLERGTAGNFSSVSSKQTRGEGRRERASVPAHGTGAATRCLLTHLPDAISIASALKEIYEDIYVSESVSGPPCGSVVYMGLYGL
jgi:hypothetical protein